jgi:hypothetical protein
LNILLCLNPLLLCTCLRDLDVSLTYGGLVFAISDVGEIISSFGPPPKCFAALVPCLSAVSSLDRISSGCM